jgi:alpha-glucosidase
LQTAVHLGAKGEPRFEVTDRGKTIATGSLGLALADGGRLQDGFRIVDTRRASRDETYSIPVGKASTGRDHHNDLVVSLEEIASHRKLDLAFRAFDDGVAFRYVIPKQQPIGELLLTDELTQISFPGDPTAHFLPLSGYTTPYEAYYETKPVSAIGPDTLIGLPMLLERTGGGAPPVWMAITEANLVDYAGMYLSRVADAADTFAANLSPLPNRADGAKVLGKTPLATPWRVLMVAGDLGRLIESQIVFHQQTVRDWRHLRTAGKTTSLVERLA